MTDTQTRLRDRVPAQIDVMISGTDSLGSSFIETTSTLEISRYGAKLALRQVLAPDQEFVIRNAASGEEVEARVIGKLISDSEGRFSYGMAFLKPSPTFWGIEFPAVSPSRRFPLPTARKR
jgi:hypothetical protein